MSFTITKISANNFSHFDGFKTMNFSNWEIVFNYTSNTLILQMLNGAPFPKLEVLATDVIIKNGTGGTPETFTTTALIRARLIELGYNALVTSGGGGGAVDSVNGQTGTVVLDAGDVGAIPLTGTEVGSPITGDLEFYNASEDVSVFIKFNASDGTYLFGTDEQYLLNSGFVLINGSFTSSLTSNADAFKVMSTDPDFKGLEGESDFTDNLTDLCYPQKIYVDTKLPIETPATTGVALTFATDRVYGSIASPETGNITASTTGAKLGVTNIIIHNSGTAPTFDSKFKKLSGSGSYVISVVNYIYCTYITSTEIIYSINQRT